MSKPVILTGLRVNNQLHIGNYFGAIKPIVDIANQKAGEYQINLFIPDLHSFTTPIDHDSLQDNIFAALRLFVAAGLPIDHPDVHIYRQSYIPAHSELTWILDCFTGMGEMSRMTQFKDKSSDLRDERVSVGLFGYPVLMAADILLYDASYVPVGEDQTQHLEFVRDIATRLNSKFGQLFVVPHDAKAQHKFFDKDQGLRIRDLQSPGDKMSKSSDSEKGIIYLTDPVETAMQKVKAAATDSLHSINRDYREQPGVSNLLDLLDLLGGSPDQYFGQTEYGTLKTDVADRVGSLLSDLESRLLQVDDDKVRAKLAASEVAMQEQANQTLLKVQTAVGLR